MNDRVAEHYGSEGVTDRIRAALGVGGRGFGELDPDALAGVDEFHLGGRTATEALLDDVDPQPGSTVIDVGCGIGGAARVMARRGCTVLGFDLTPEFVDAARELTVAAGLSDRVRFEVGSGLELPSDEGSADLATMLHVGMNIADKPALMRELARVVRAGGAVAVYDVMRVGAGEIRYPVPWASDADHSFVEPPQAYVDAMEAAGLTDVVVTPRLDLVLDALAAAQAGPPPTVHLGHLMGPKMSTMLDNLIALLHGGVLAPTQIIGRR